MDPMYRYMMPHPYQRDHMDYRPNYHPRPEAVPPLMYMNPTQSPFDNEYWPWGSGYPYPPATCHGCCNHSHMPSHNAWRPPYSHIPPAYYPQSYPPFPSQYVPPPHYAMKQPQFSYNNMPRDNHCCGCPNHICSQKEQRSVKIEEEEPEREKVNKNAPVAPFKFKNSPHPVMWFPIDHGDNKEHQKDLKDVSADAKPNTEWKTDEKQPGGWFGWYPLESNKFRSSKEKGEKIIGHESDDGKGRFPFPVYWMSYPPEEKEKEESTEKIVNPKRSLEPVKDSGEKAGGQPSSVVKDIPVKELKPHEENLTSTNKEDRRDSSIKDVTGSREKLTKNDPKRKSSSTPKSSKLPPVCLRVDPLPRIKDTNGSSRSPSPPGDTRKPDQVSNEVRKVLSPPDRKDKPDQVTNKESKEGKGTTKAIKVVDVNTSQEERSKKQTQEKHEKERIPAEFTKSDDAVMKVQSEDTGSARAENGDVSSVKEEVKTPSKPKLSEEDAAVIIQSAYRGFDIRRRELVKKLKEIARVREQIAEVRNLIQAMETSEDNQGDSKQRNTIAETIMSLLLKLDTIQGLHPSIREVRKSVVRELVSLQEKLEALINDKSKALQEQESVAERRDENALKETVDAISSHGSNKAQSDLVGPCQNQLDGMPNKASEISEKSLVTKKLDNEASEVSESCTPEGSVSAIELTRLKEEDEQSSQTGERSLTKEDGVDSVLGRGTECSVDEVVDSLSNDKDKTESELPLEVADDLLRLSDAEIGEPDQAKQPDEGMKGAYNSASNRDTNEGERDYTESFDQLGVPLGENTKSDDTETTNLVDGLLEEGCTLCEESGTTKQVDSGFEPDECCAQPPKSVFSDIFESPEVADKKENPIAAEASNVKDANSNTSQADSSVVEEARDMLPMKEYDAEQEPSKESTNIDEKIAEEISLDITVSNRCSVELRGDGDYEQALYEEKQAAQNQEHLSLGKNSKGECLEGEGANEEENAPEITSVVAADVDQGSSQVCRLVVGDEPIKRDEKLIEEKEKLKDVVEKLVKSGQEHLRVISSLSGRIKDLERNMSKKRKLKVKPYKRRSSSIKELTDQVVV